MSCSIPTNQPIYQALLDKAASYPSDKMWQACAYRGAAETVRTYKANIYEEFATYGKFDLQPWYIGKSTEKFIGDFIKQNPEKKPVATVPEMKCSHPANEEIYKSLVWKANQYPADQPFKKAAYLKAAEKIAKLDVNLWAVSSADYFKILDTFGPRTSEYIDDFVTDNYEHDYLGITKDEDKQEDDYDSVEEAICSVGVDVEANFALYRALILKAASYSDAQVYQKRAYLKAARMVASADFSYYTKDEREYDLAFHWGKKTAAFVEEFIQNNPLIPVRAQKKTQKKPAARR
jgi:DNA polymerase/3'-5' exonuclease PolX